MADDGVRSLEVLMMAGVANLLDGQAAEGASLLAEAISQVAASDNPRRFSWAGSCAFYLGDMGGATAYWGRFVDEARSQGAIALLAVALAYRASGEAAEGRFASAVVTASEGLRLAEETGQANAAAFHRSVLARGAARCGREEECRAQAAAVFAVARERRARHPRRPRPARTGRAGACRGPPGREPEPLRDPVARGARRGQRLGEALRPARPRGGGGPGRAARHRARGARSTTRTG